MRLTKPLLRLTVLAALLPGAALAWTATEQDAAYQRSMSHLQAAMQALDVARREVSAAQRAASLPGFDYERLHAEMTAINQRLGMYLTPIQRQDRFETLRPDAVYFNPNPTLHNQGDMK